MNKIYYNQADKRWANHPYPSPSLPKATIKSGGCGATSAAMIISNMTNENIFPSAMGDLFRQTGYRVNGGTSGNAFPYIARKWGLECNVKVKLDDAVACLKRGGMVVANVKAGGVFSTGGHYIVLAYMKDGNTIAVFDPYMYSGKFNTSFRKNKVRVSGNTVFISYSNMKNYGNYSNLYCFEPKQVVNPSSKFSAGEYAELKVNVGICCERENDRLQVDDGHTQFLVHKSLVKNGVLLARVQVAYAQGEDYIVEVFGDQFWARQGNLRKY